MYIKKTKDNQENTNYTIVFANTEEKRQALTSLSKAINLSVDDENKKKYYDAINTISRACTKKSNGSEITVSLSEDNAEYMFNFFLGLLVSSGEQLSFYKDELTLHEEMCVIYKNMCEQQNKLLNSYKKHIDDVEDIVKE